MKASLQYRPTDIDSITVHASIQKSNIIIRTNIVTNRLIMIVIISRIYCIKNITSISYCFPLMFGLTILNLA